jgi:hypothetical protein
VINRLKFELDAKTAAPSKVNRHKTPPPLDKNDGFSPKGDWLSVGGITLADTEAAITRLNAELNERSSTADSQRIEIVALKVQIEALKDQIANLGTPPAQHGIETDGRRASLRLVS